MTLRAHFKAPNCVSLHSDAMCFAFAMLHVQPAWHRTNCTNTMQLALTPGSNCRQCPFRTAIPGIRSEHWIGSPQSSETSALLGRTSHDRSSVGRATAPAQLILKARWIDGVGWLI